MNVPAVGIRVIFSFLGIYELTQIFRNDCNDQFCHKESSIDNFILSSRILKVSDPSGLPVSTYSSTQIQIRIEVPLIITIIFESSFGNFSITHVYINFNDSILIDKNSHSTCRE